MDPLGLIGKYRFAFIASAIIVVAGITAFTLNSAYSKGYNQAKAESEVILKKMRLDMDALKLELEEEQSNIKEKIIIEYVDKIRIVKEKEYVYINQAGDVPSNCELTNGWVYLHDSAVRGSDAESSGVADGKTSGIADNIALETVIKNYSIHQQTVEQLTALQNWIKDTQASIEAANKKRKK